MSRIAPQPEREPVEIDGRHMSAARRARIIARDGCCTYPGCEVAVGLEVDHVIALALGGRDDDANLACLCADHHKRKTALDLKLIAKAKRRALKAAGTFPPSPHRLKGQGFRKRWTP